MAKYYDASGAVQEVPLGLSIYREAQAAGMSVDSYINSKHETREGDAPAFDQMLASLGVSLRTNKKAGIRASKLSDVLNGTTGMDAAANTREGAPESRIIFPAAILSAIEDKLARDLTETSTAYGRLVAMTDTIPGNQFVRIVTNFDKPEAARNRRTAQLARPQNFMLMTASERPAVVPTVSLGLEWSDQVTQNTTLDFVALSVARQVAIQGDEDAQHSLLAILNGDEDIDQGAIPAAHRYEAHQFDSSITTAGKLTQKAWVKWLYQGRSFRRIDWIITDIDTALAIENREGKPVVVGDDGTSPRINTDMRVANPVVPASVQVFITDNPNWPAGTILGMDSRFGIHRVISLSANYSATEQDVMRRANSMRWDSGSISYRLYDEAFSVLELAAP